MDIQLSGRFETALKRLQSNEQETVLKALNLLADNLRHPSLRVKRVQGTRDIWEARASRSLRMTFQFSDDAIVLRNVGQHDQTLSNP